MMLINTGSKCTSAALDTRGFISSSQSRSSHGGILLASRDESVYGGPWSFGELLGSSFVTLTGSPELRWLDRSCNPCFRSVQNVGHSLQGVISPKLWRVRLAQVD